LILNNEGVVSKGQPFFVAQHHQNTNFLKHLIPANNNKQFSANKNKQNLATMVHIFRVFVKLKMAEIQ